MENYDSSSAAVGIFSGIFGLLYLVFLVVVIVGLWKVFEKAGKPGWAAIIPIYNLIVLLEIVGKPVWWIVLFLIPCVNFVFIIWTWNLLSKSFGQSEGFTVGMVLLPFVFIPMLGFGNYTYLGPAGLGGVSNFNRNDFRDPFNNNNNPPTPPTQY
ncbi:DUF5684 domain-containing protein [Mucilaginibacter terrae]|uniref:DUF5684 domain-containing protein n=1 Tax=Mucilaginibacter terrae TaxID=1955052 RepID=UPI00363E4850